MTLISVAQGAAAFQEHGEIPALATWDAHVLGLVPDERCVVEYRWHDRAPTDGHEPSALVIGKFYADGTGERTYQTMQLLHAALADTPAAPLAIPRPLFYDSRQRMLAQERAAGIPYRSLLGHPEFRSYFHLAGQALAFLHTRDIALGTPASLQEHLADLIHPHPREFAARVPAFAGRVVALLQALDRQEQIWRGRHRIAPLHRDFHLRQLLYDRDRVSVIDWDLFGRGDPALDIGNFLVNLRKHLAAAADPAGASFLTGYQTVCPASEFRAILLRVPFFQAFTYLRLACKYYRLHADGWWDATHRALLCAERLLAAAPDRLPACRTAPHDRRGEEANG